MTHVIPLLASALQAPFIVQLSDNISILHRHLGASFFTAISQQSESLLSTTRELYDLLENPSTMTWLRLSQFHSFSLALTMQTLWHL